MMSIPINIVLVEDHPADAELIIYELRQAGYMPMYQRVETEATYLAALNPAIDIILADYSLPQFDALRALELMLASNFDIPFIIVSGTIGEEVAVSAMRHGAADYLLKDRLARLGLAVAHALEQRRLRIEARRATAALQASAELNQAVLTALTAEIAVLDSSGRIIAVNDAWKHFARTHGDPTFSATGIDINYLDVCRRAADNGNNAEAAQALLGLQALIDGVQSYYTLEYGYQTPEEVRWYTMHATNLTNHDGIVVAHEDITERKRAEQAMHAAETNYRMLVEHIPAIIYRAAIDSTSSTLYVNPQIETILGFSSEEWLADPQRWLTQLHPHDFDLVLNGVARAHTSNEPIHSEFRMLARDGHEVWFHDEAVVVRDADGQPIFLQGVMLDISDRKRIEAQLIQAQKMESIGRLAGGIAHDFNNMLSVIIGFIGSAQEVLPPDNPAQRALKIAEQSAWRGAKLTRQLLTFARKQIVELRVLNLNIVIADLDDMLRRLIGEDIEFVALLTADLKHVHADVGQLEQVITNLVVNARDAMPSGGKLILKTANVTVADDSQQQIIAVGEYVLLTISDNGSGIDPEVQQHIFEPFFTTKEIGKGTGLGLATCYSIIKQHGGTIKIDSTLGIGTTVTVYLPCVVAAIEEPPQSTEHASVVRGTEMVLLVEDEPLVRELERAILNEQGYVVVEASNGEEAWRIVQALNDTQIALLVTDVVMPQMGGHALAELVLGMHPNIKVLFVSGYTTDTFIHHNRLDSATNVLTKPFTRMAFARKVREVLDS
jgi:PAS domain S-box-containing protein